ncbi:MAG TPA: M48 family metallopeptidase [Planctomycetota bacterium]
MSTASYPKTRPGRLRAGVALLLALGLAAGCRTTPVTGRRALNVFSTEDDIRLGQEAYAQVLADAKRIGTGKDHEMVVRVMNKLAAVADDAGYPWEVTLIDDPETVNAFALPGGKMAVYTGILPVCQGETGLAVVMGHEIGHVVAAHGTERMTTSLGAELVLAFIGQNDYAQLARLGSEYLVQRPFGRRDESEADEIGLVYMARAGYDPREAVAFWERMAAGSGGGPPEFLSTHPSHETRVERLKAKMPEALEIWRQAGGGAQK